MRHRYRLAWPGLIVATIMAALFLYSAAQILKQAWGEFDGSTKLTVP